MPATRPLTRPGVREIEYGTTIGEVAALAGTVAHGTAAVPLGGCFGGWASLDDVHGRPLDPVDMGEDRLPFGCGVVSFAGSDTCGVRDTAEIMTFMAGESAAQSGPCVFGLVAIAEATGRLAVGALSEDDRGASAGGPARSGAAARATIPMGPWVCSAARRT
jgi:NADH:ubiquinone oxidoreductase subunit F (NADH-binding)